MIDTETLIEQARKARAKAYAPLFTLSGWRCAGRS